MQFNEKLKALREDADFTQKELAALLDTTQQQIYKYETGSQEMTISRLRQVCIVFGVSADYLLGLPKSLKWPR